MFLLKLQRNEPLINSQKTDTDSLIHQTLIANGRYFNLCFIYRKVWKEAEKLFSSSLNTDLVQWAE